MFGLFYAIAGRLQGAGSEDEKERETWQPAQTAGVFASFCLRALFRGQRRPSLPTFIRSVILLLLLSAVAGWLSRVQDFPLLSTGSASGSVAVVAVWWPASGMERRAGLGSGGRVRSPGAAVPCLV